MRTLGKLEYCKAWSNKTNVWMITDIQPHVAIKLKSLFPKISKEQTNNFVFENNGNNCADLDWFRDRFPLTMSEDDAARLRLGRFEYEQQLEHIEKILLPDYTPPPFSGLKPGCSVRNYQAQAVQVLMLRGSLLLGDKMGLGKTFSAMAAMLQPGTLPAAVVVKTHLQIQWKEAIESFTDLKVHCINKASPYENMLNGTQELPKADVYIFKYSQLSGWSDIFATGFFKFAIYDEIQELRRGDESAKGRGAYVLSNHTKYRLGLSGTPLVNYGIEIHNIMKAIDDTVLGDRISFMREWGGDDKKSVREPDALGAFLREQQVFLRRTRRDIGQEAPPINRIFETVSTDTKAMNSIREIARQLAIKTVSGSFTQRGSAARELDLLARMTTGVAKAKSVAAYVKLLLDDGIPVVLAGWHREVYEIWLRELKDYNPMMFTGSESASQKRKNAKAFMDGKSNLLIMSLRSGDGLNGLQYRCSFVVFGELDWSAQFHDQMIARLDREHQPDQVTAIFLNSSDGSDPPMIDLLARKSDQARGIIDPNEAPKATFTDLSRVKALAQQFLDQEMIEKMKNSNEEVPDLPDAEMENIDQEIIIDMSEA
ncbi:MAG: SNF2-related protein [Hafnia sp.]